MKKFSSAILILAVTLPFAAQAQQRLTEEQLIQRAVEQNTCGELSVLSAVYDEKVANRVIVTCGDAEGFVPLAGLGAAAGAGAAGLVLVAVAAGGSSTPSTSGTN